MIQRFRSILYTTTSAALKRMQRGGSRPGSPTGGGTHVLAFVSSSSSSSLSCVSARPASILQGQGRHCAVGLNLPLHL